MPVEECKPGMMAKALTVFSGTKIEEFDVEIVDIYHNFFPGRNAILIRLHGEKATFAGPTSGMSGSPVYYQGKLIGAIAYSFSNFVKDPLMGVTPAGEMLEIFDWQKIRDRENGFAAFFPIDRTLAVAVGAADPTWEIFTEPVQTRLATRGGLQQLNLPLQFNGFSHNSLAPVLNLFENNRLNFLQGGSTSSSEVEGGELEPGSAIAAVLMSGDYSIAATGTVTYRNGKHVLGFGHPFFDNGPVALPMAQAHIMATMASAQHSTKMSLTGKIVGTVYQDRKTGIMGEIGPIPEMVPIRFKYIAENGKETDYNFSLAQEPSMAFLSPLILRIALVSGVESARLATGYNTLAVSGFARLKDGRVLSLDNFYPGYQPLAGFSFLNSTLHSTGQIAASLSSIANNNFAAKPFSEVQVSFKSIAGRKSAQLEKIWVDKSTVSPGDSLLLYYRLKPYQKPASVGVKKIVIPRAFSARYLTLLASGAQNLARVEKRNFPAKFQPDNFDQLFNLLKNTRKNNRLYVQIVSFDKGAFIGNRELPDLPPSIYPVVKSGAAKGDLVTSRFQVNAELALPQPFMIEGLQQLRIKIKK